MQQHGWVLPTDWKKLHTGEYILYDSIYKWLKNKRKWPMVLEVKIMENQDSNKSIWLQSYVLTYYAKLSFQKREKKSNSSYNLIK